MRAPIQPDRSLLRVRAEEVLDGDHRLRPGIDLFGDANADRPAVDIGRHVRAALMLWQREARCVPAVCVLAARGVHRNSEVVAEFWSRAALGLVLMKRAHPIAV